MHYGKSNCLYSSKSVPFLYRPSSASGFGYGAPAARGAPVGDGLLQSFGYLSLRPFNGPCNFRKGCFNCEPFTATLLLQRVGGFALGLGLWP